MNSCQIKCAWLLAAVCCNGSGSAADDTAKPVETALPAGEIAAPGVLLIGHIENPRITESSGVVASRRYPGVFWTHNDGGGPRRQVLYAISREGKSQAAFSVVDVFLHDWEDIAIDNEGHLFIGDIGNNEARRSEVAVYQIDEPDPSAKAGVVHVRTAWRLRFPGGPFDCESLFVWKSYGYVVSKVFKDARAQIFRFPLTEQKAPATLELVATTKIESPVTGADISPDGKLLALMSKAGPFVFRVNGDIARVIKGKPYQTKFRHEHIEGCCFVPEGLLATAESREIYLFTAPAFHWK